MRALMADGPTATYVWHSIAWNLGILAVFPLLAVCLYRGGLRGTG